MTANRTTGRALVLLIGEVLEDPRVFRTCTSLVEAGAGVTVACTNPSLRPERETCGGFGIVRFPHRREFIVKRIYRRLQAVLPAGAAGAMAGGHEHVPSSPFRAAIRNTLLAMNYRHFDRQNERIRRAMVRTFDCGSFDLVHANDVDTLSAGAALKRSGAARELLYDSHEYWAGIGVHGSAPNEAIRRMEADGVARADHVVTVNPLIAERLREQYGLGSRPAVVMNCPYRRREGIETDHVNDPVRIIYLGKLQAFRGLRELVLAFHHVVNGTLTLAGDGPLEGGLARLAADEGIGDRVFFTGKYDPGDIMRILAGHDIGVMPFHDVTLNLVYTSPNKLFDYAMAGLAIAGSDLPFLRSIIGKHDMGDIFGAVTPEGIADTLNAMTADRGGLVRRRSNARAAAMDELCWEEQFSRYPWRPGGSA